MAINNLQLGSTGDNVKILQEKLKILGFYNAIITGSFGPTTEVGVRAFQNEYGLKETGIVDNEMWEMILDLTQVAYYTLNNDPNLNLGSSGEYVKELQTKLKSLLYYTGPINSVFDKETEIAVKRLQFHNKLTTTGVVNNQTWVAIDSLYGNLNECASGGSNNNDDITYTVVSGDTLYSIAKRYNTTVDAIKSLNHLTSNLLRVGQVLKIPTTNQENYITYTVLSGDTLYSIAKRYNTTVDAIKSLNHLTSNMLSVGQVLKIPTTNQENNITYTVVRGDTLYSIAKRYNTTVDAIKSLNHLTSNMLSIGQVLKIPTTNQENYITYTVARGDTLYSIANRYNTTVDAIKSLNHLTSNMLSVGQVLKIPTTN